MKTVADLIAHLQTLPQGTLVVYREPNERPARFVELGYPEKVAVTKHEPGFIAPYFREWKARDDEKPLGAIAF